uniref:G_PROTEIN_RECEP_F1_2 domain-containing protein n=1 Tax=Macrostomum lignano TaxID=282301 RepID=A0A1I8HXS6_9PLAT
MSSTSYCLPKALSVIGNVTANGTGSSADDALSVYEVVFYALLATAASAVTAFGNLLVLVSFRIDRQLQTVSNYYLMSLAVADLLIGFVSMPIYTVYLLVTYWPFDIIVCNLYLCFDYTMCNASVASLLIISIDRYRSVTSPLIYRSQRTPKRALIMITCAWDKVATVCQVEFINDNPYLTFFTSIMAFFLPVTVMTILYVRIFRETKKRQRELQSLQAGCGGGGGGGSTAAASSSNDESRTHPDIDDRIEEVDEQQECLTYVVWIRLPDASGQTRIQLRSKRTAASSSEQQLSTRCIMGQEATGNIHSRGQQQQTPQQQQQQQVAIVVANASASSADASAATGAAAADADAVSRFDSAKSNATADSGIDSIGGGGDGPAGLHRVGSPPKQPAPTSRRPSHAQQQQQTQKPQANSGPKTSSSSNSSKKETKNEQKAAKTLSAILLVFIVTWIPYNVFTLIRAVYRAHCPDEYFRPLIPDTLYNFGYWLCYLNSTMNPVCYALCNANFRRTFWKILTCKSRKRRTLRHLGQGLYSHTRVVHAVAPTAGTRQPR